VLHAKPGVVSCTQSTVICILSMNLSNHSQRLRTLSPISIKSHPVHIPPLRPDHRRLSLLVIFVKSAVHVLDTKSAQVSRRIIGTKTYIERFQLRITLPQHPSFEPPRRSFTSLVGDELLARDGEDVVELFQGPLLGFRYKEEDHDEGANIETGIESEGTYLVSVGMTSYTSWRGDSPVGVKAARIAGNEIESTEAQKRQVATAQPMPTSRWLRGKTSAE
jgi:hypothetical protein